jgi:hypothetical protein
MSHQNSANPANVYPYGPDIKDPNPEVVDLSPSEIQPPGVDEEEIDLETALTSL